MSPAIFFSLPTSTRFQSSLLSRVLEAEAVGFVSRFQIGGCLGGNATDKITTFWWKGKRKRP